MLVSRLHLYRRKIDAVQPVRRPEKPYRPQELLTKSQEPVIKEHNEANPEV